MIPYIILYLYLIFTYIIDKYATSKKFTRFFFNYRISIILLILFAGLRGNGDGDYFRYYNSVQLIDSINMVLKPIDYPFEIGFRILSFIAVRFNFDPQAVIFSMALMSLVILYYILKKYSKNINLSLVIYFPTYLIFILHHSRAGVAMSFGLLFVHFLITKKIAGSILAFVLAISFHKTAIILVIVPFGLLGIKYSSQFDFIPSKIKNNKNTFVYILLLFMIILVLFYNPFTAIVTILRTVGFTNISRTLEIYLEDPMWSYPFKMIDPRLLLLIGTYLFSSSVRIKRTLETKIYNFLLFVTIFLIVFLSNSTILVMRTMSYFNQFSCLQLPSLDYSLRNSKCQKNDPKRNLLERKIDDFSSKYSSFIFNSLIVANVLYTFGLIYVQVQYKFFNLF